jgi:RNA polymerase sigma-70 factor (ECF subfamily)
MAVNAVAPAFGWGRLGAAERGLAAAPIRGALNKNEFMQACREGGGAIEKALRQLDRTFFATLYARALHTLRDAELARDLVQETFIKVWQRCATFEGGSELRPWIEAILRHTLLDRLRKPQRDVSFEEGAEMSEELAERVFELSQQQIGRPDDEARQQQLAECFQRCWQRFEEAAPAHAAVIKWVVEDGLSHEQIAELLDRTPGATREFVSQCRKRARLHLAEWYQLAFGTDEVT